MIEVEAFRQGLRVNHGHSGCHLLRAEPGEILGFFWDLTARVKPPPCVFLAGYLPASQGTARVAGYDVHSDSMAVRQRIGLFARIAAPYIPK